MKRLTIFAALLLCFAATALAQSERDYIRRGNRLMRDSVLDKAQIEYQKAVEADNTSAMAQYNLGNAFDCQGQDSAALKSYEQAAKLETNKVRRAQIYHNMGVLLQSAKQLDKALAAYKQALRNDPTAHDTRYNYALCLYQLKNQQGQDNQEQEKDENGEDEKNEQQQNEQQKQQQQNDKSEQQKEQPNPNEMSRENAEQILQAAMQDEKETQEKVQKAMQQPQDKRLKKQW